MKNTFLLLLFAALAALANGQATIINENIQNWTSTTSFGNQNQTVSVSPGTNNGLVQMVYCAVQPSQGVNGIGTMGAVIISKDLEHAIIGSLELPEVPSVSTIEFHFAAVASGRSIQLQRKDGSNWIDVTTFTNIGTNTVQAIYAINSGSPITLRLYNPFFSYTQAGIFTTKLPTMN